LKFAIIEYQWLICLMHRATRWKAACLIPSGVIGIRPYYGPGVDSVSNRNKYQDLLLEQRRPVFRADNLTHLHVPIVLKSGSPNVL